jgi:tight adherence protein C
MPIVVIAALAFIAIASVLLYIIYLALPRKTVVEERIDSMTPAYADEMIFAERRPTRWQIFLGRLGANIPMRTEDLGKYQRMFIAAGMKHERLPIFMGVKILMTIALPVGYLLLYGIPIEKDPVIRVLMAIGLAIAGIWIPNFWLRYKVNTRRTQIFHDLPDLLDLMTVCVEAGLSMDAAMIKVSDDEQFKKTALVRELRIALQETRAGKPRLEALRDMGERAMVDDLKAFAAMLIQTERLGTSLAQSLRIFSDSLRTERRQIAEEAAAKTTIKLMFPLVFCIFPALLVVILGPAILRIMAFLKDL